MKKFLTLFLIIVLFGTLISCGGGNEDASSNQTPTPSQPVDNPTIPEDNPTVPEDNPTIPEDNPTVPEDNPTVPEDNPTIPDNPTVPDDPTIPDNPIVDLATTINNAIVELDSFLLELIDKIPYESIKNPTREYYEVEKAKLKNVESVDDVSARVSYIKSTVQNFVISKSKEYAVEELQEIADIGLQRVANEEIKNDLNVFLEGEFEKINNIENVDDLAPTLAQIVSETKDYVQNLVVTTLKSYVERVTEIQNANAYDYLPEAMNPVNNLVNLNTLTTDFTSFVNVNNISQLGYGEQWQMVVENVNQSKMVATVFNLAQTALNSAGNLIDIYLENSFSYELYYEFNEENFSGLFTYEYKTLAFYIRLNKSISIPGIGEVKPIIRMEYDLENDIRGMFIGLGDAYKIKYVVAEDTYEMATTYGIKVAGQEASRTSYLSIETENDKTIGHIYEYTTLNGSDKIAAAADFYIENDYVSVVGNKASGMIAFDGYVSELYSATNGKLLGYEVREELTILGVTGTYNTLWFNIWDINGINSIKVTEKTNDNESDKSVVNVYLNGNNTLLKPTYNSKAFVETSRKYDVELRSRFYYSYDESTEEYIVTEVKVPMFFIQEGDNFESFETDFKKNNKIEVSVGLNSTHLNKILSDYDTLVDIFIENKGNMSSEIILNYLKQYE